jgi:hypothetical protein
MNIMHGIYNIKAKSFQQAKCMKKYKNTRLKLLDLNASILIKKQYQVQFYNKWLDKFYLTFDVLEISMIKSELHEDSADERRNASEY